jgi:hypothetical protein
LKEREEENGDGIPESSTLTSAIEFNAEEDI